MLHIIARHCNLNMLNFVTAELKIKELKKIINQTDNEDNTPLLVACFSGFNDTKFNPTVDSKEFHDNRF